MITFEFLDIISIASGVDAVFSLPSVAAQAFNLATKIGLVLSSRFARRCASTLRANFR